MSNTFDVYNIPLESYHNLRPTLIIEIIIHYLVYRDMIWKLRKYILICNPLVYVLKNIELFNKPTLTILVRAATHPTPEPPLPLPGTSQTFFFGFPSKVRQLLFFRDFWNHYWLHPERLDCETPYTLRFHNERLFLRYLKIAETPSLETDFFVLTAKKKRLNPLGRYLSDGTSRFNVFFFIYNI